jgi:hypothetical protein
MNKLLAQLHNPVLPNIIGGGDHPDYTKGGSALGSLVSSLVGALFIAGFLLAFFFLLQGGLTWITSGGDKTKLEKARDIITNSIIGIIVVGASYAIATLLAQFFGLDLKTLPIPAVGK